MNTEQKIRKYVSGRKTGATCHEICSNLGLNKNTARKVLGRMRIKEEIWALPVNRKCRVSGKRDLILYTSM